MTFHILILFLSVISITHLFNNVSALPEENLVSDNLAPPTVFTYQVAIVGRYNKSNYPCLFCGGGIIGEKLILAAAQCFMKDNGEQIGLHFSVIANTTNLKSEGGIELPIDRIYIIGHEPHFIHDITVAQLTEELGLTNNPYLSKLDIPDPYESFYRESGIVAGYGYNWVYTDYSTEHQKIIRLAGGTDKLLRYAIVQIVNHFVCTYDHVNVDFQWRLCAKVITENNELWGICEYDAGSPLVIGKKVVGIVSSPHFHCIDIDYGGMYTNVALYVEFINAIINGQPLNSTLIYYNRQHVI